MQTSCICGTLVQALACRRHSSHQIPSQQTVSTSAVVSCCWLSFQPAASSSVCAHQSHSCHCYQKSILRTGRHAKLQVAKACAGMAGSIPARWQAGSIFSAKPQPGGSLIATACSDGVLRAWDLRSGQLVNSLSIPVHDGMMAACAWDPNGYCIASVATAGDMSVLVSWPAWIVHI